ncbi:hypothetical protein D3C80_2045780 [compost metagenome]
MHPRLSDHGWLRAITKADIMVPAFGNLADAPQLTNGLDAYWSVNRIIDVSDTRDKKSNDEN